MAGAQVLSPLKKVVLDGVPVADSDAVKVPLFVIGPPVIFIKSFAEFDELSTSLLVFC